MDTNCRTAYSSPRYVSPGWMASVSPWPCDRACSRKDSAVSVTASLMGKGAIFRGDSSSSMRLRVTREFTSSVSFSVWAWALSIHFCCPTSISSTFRLVAMTVMGVFSSWLASVMNCFCRWALRTTGSMARRLSSTTSRSTNSVHPASAASDHTSTVRMARSC